jgi:hypothetical protein
MNEDTVRFEQDREKQLRQLHDRQSAEMNKFLAENGMQSAETNGDDDSDAPLIDGFIQL